MAGGLEPQLARGGAIEQPGFEHAVSDDHGRRDGQSLPIIGTRAQAAGAVRIVGDVDAAREHPRSEEHTSELQSLMRMSYTVFCLKKKQLLTLPVYVTFIAHSIAV